MKKSDSITWVNAITHTPDNHTNDIFVNVIIATANGCVFPASYNKLLKRYYLGKKVINYVVFFAYYPSCPRKLIKETFTEEELMYLRFGADTEES